MFYIKTHLVCVVMFLHNIFQNTLARYLIYTAIIFSAMLALPAIVGRWGAHPFYENGAIEWLQFLVLFCTVAIFLNGARQHAPSRVLLLVISGPPALAATRELDSLLDRLLPVIGWKFGYLFLLGAILLGICHFKTLWSQSMSFITTPAFVFLWIGFVIAIPLAQLLGHRPIFRLLIESGDIRGLKRIVEESLELMGYLVLLFGAVETMVHLSRKHRDHRGAAAEQQ